MIMLPIMLLKDINYGTGLLTTCHQPLGLCMVTLIWLSWPLTKKSFFLFARYLGKGKLGTTCIINWAFLIPMLTSSNRVEYGTLGPIFELGLMAFKMPWSCHDHCSIIFLFFSRSRITSDHYPIYFTISWQPTIQRSIRAQFFLNTLGLIHASIIAHILCV